MLVEDISPTVTVSPIPPAGVVDKTLYTDTPIVHTRLRELNRASFGRYGDTVTVGENVFDEH